MSKNKSSSNFGVLIIVIGIAILLGNLNILKLSMFWGIVKLWPFLLIIAGLSMLFKNVRYISVILWLAFLGVVIGYSYLNMDQKTWFFGEKIDLITYTEDVGDLNEAVLNFDLNHGEINIDSGESLIYEIPEAGMDYVAFEKNEGSQSVLTLREENFKDMFMSVQSRVYNLTLPEKGVWALNIDGGAVSLAMDLSHIHLTDLNLSFGVGDLDLVLSEESSGRFYIEFGVGDVTLEIPSSVGVKLIADSGLTSIDVPSGYSKNEDVYYSDNYETAKNQVELHIDLGVGSFELK